MPRIIAEKNREKVSRFGLYQGYTEKVYDGTQRRSDYLALSDGTKLAYDLILPKEHEIQAGTPFPVLFKNTPYLRTWTIFDKNGKSNLAELEALSWYEDLYLWIRSRLLLHRNIQSSIERCQERRTPLRRSKTHTIVG